MKQAICPWCETKLHNVCSDDGDYINFKRRLTMVECERGHRYGLLPLDPSESVEASEAELNGVWLIWPRGRKPPAPRA